MTVTLQNNATFVEQSFITKVFTTDSFKCLLIFDKFLEKPSWETVVVTAACIVCHLFNTQSVFQSQVFKKAVLCNSTSWSSRICSSWSDRHTCASQRVSTLAFTRFVIVCQNIDQEKQCDKMSMLASCLLITRYYRFSGTMMRFKWNMSHLKSHQECFMQLQQKSPKHSSLVCHWHGVYNF